MIDTSIMIVDAESTTAALPFQPLVNELQSAFGRGCVVPVRHHHTIERTGEPDATLLLMPAWSNPNEEDQYLGVKLVTVVPGNDARGLPGLTSTYMLYNAVDGRQLALMDGNAITSRRTVATSALAARFLSREDARSLLVIGAGRVASLIPEAYQAVRPIEKVAIWDINIDNARALAKSLGDRGICAEIVSDLEQAVGRADVISAATLSTSAIIKGAWIKSGTHIDLIGGFTPNMREADDVALALSKAYVDTREALHEAGDLIQPIEAGVVSEDHVQGTLADLAKGLIQGRTKAEEITYFKAVGSGLADLAAAKMVYEKIQAGGR
ncbi:ornithine cyclodeaminase family protein [Sinorhizobium meliloti]|uniref:ornithine cyclodeaminase family protein n=1 Tax=Rhizobium meliloti TaxID=382 RepID=UPI000FDA02D4|nr:ornithine cyclodeaminase family protein [Sinorhizobium meliloti]RVG23082.1 ornithine cyclodeaminase family protein [Sinorhizobium meliloti]RVL00696.1 ornithine cyclodeaminase family protein [Sinorhizobium meliloti]RVN46431.1 ornithine cyclodeaminase family protein [Sinorhizobium meliloti]